MRRRIGVPQVPEVSRATAGRPPTTFGHATFIIRIVVAPTKSGPAETTDIDDADLKKIDAVVAFCKRQKITCKVEVETHDVTY